MKNLSSKQIAQVKEIKTWTSTKFHGNTKKVGSILVDDLKAIVAKKNQREIAKISECKRPLEVVRKLIATSKKYKGTNYYKVMVEGYKGIYYAHPLYRLDDYNKQFLFEKTEYTAKLMRIFNKIISHEN